MSTIINSFIYFSTIFEIARNVRMRSYDHISNRSEGVSWMMVQSPCVIGRWELYLYDFAVLISLSFMFFSRSLCDNMLVCSVVLTPNLNENWYLHTHRLFQSRGRSECSWRATMKFVPLLCHHESFDIFFCLDCLCACVSLFCWDNPFCVIIGCQISFLSDSFLPDFPCLLLRIKTGYCSITSVARGVLCPIITWSVARGVLCPINVCCRSRALVCRISN